MRTMYLMLLVLFAFSCQKEVEINIKPVGAFKVNNDIIEEGQMVSFTCLSFDKDGYISKWKWDFGNGLFSEEKNPHITFDSPGSFSVLLTVWDDKGMQNQNVFSKTITVKEKSLADIQPEIVWEFQTPAGFQDIAPALDKDNNIVIGCDAKVGRPGGSDNILVVNNGNLVWKYTSGDVVRSSAAISDDGIYYIGSYDKKLYAFSASSNTPLASFNLGVNAKYSAPAIDNDGTVYYTANKKLYAISPAPNMKEIWSFDCEGVTQSTPVIHNNTIYAASNSGYVFAISKDGALKWKVQFGLTCSSVPAIDKNGSVIICGETADGGIIMSISANGNVNWQKASNAKYANSGIVTDNENQIYVGNSNGELNCLDLDNGENIWSFKAKGKIISTPAIDNDGNIYFGDDQGTFYVLNKQGKMRYKELSLGSKIWSSPVIGNDGTIYVCADLTTSSEPGKLFALKTTAISPLHSWSMRSGNIFRNGRLLD